MAPKIHAALPVCTPVSVHGHPCPCPRPSYPRRPHISATAHVRDHHHVEVRLSLQCEMDSAPPFTRYPSYIKNRIICNYNYKVLPSHHTIKFEFISKYKLWRRVEPRSPVKSNSDIIFNYRFFQKFKFKEFEFNIEIIFLQDAIIIHKHLAM